MYIYIFFSFFIHPASSLPDAATRRRRRRGDNDVFVIRCYHCKNRLACYVSDAERARRNEAETTITRSN